MAAFFMEYLVDCPVVFAYKKAPALQKVERGLVSGSGVILRIFSFILVQIFVFVLVVFIEVVIIVVI